MEELQIEEQYKEYILSHYTEYTDEDWEAEDDLVSLLTSAPSGAL